jgi:hypothetical protein
MAATLAYKIEEMIVGPEQNIEAPYAVWDATPVNLTADQAVASGKEGDKRGTDVKMFLELILANGPVAVTKIEEQAARRGISIDQLKRMKKKLLIGGQPER